MTNRFGAGRCCCVACNCGSHFSGTWDTLVLPSQRTIADSTDNNALLPSFSGQKNTGEVSASGVSTKVISSTTYLVITGLDSAYESGSPFDSGTYPVAWCTSSLYPRANFTDNKVDFFEDGYYGGTVGSPQTSYFASKVGGFPNWRAYHGDSGACGSTKSFVPPYGLRVTLDLDGVEVFMVPSSSGSYVYTQNLYECRASGSNPFSATGPFAPISSAPTTGSNTYYQPDSGHSHILQVSANATSVSLWLSWKVVRDSPNDQFLWEFNGSTSVTGGSLIGFSHTFTGDFTSVISGTPQAPSTFDIPVSFSAY